MGQLRHIAFISKQPKVLSDFYQKYFGFEECKVFPSGSRMVIDPRFNLAFLQSRGDEAGDVVGTHDADGAEIQREPGIHHYGFLVDDLNQAVSKLPASLSRGASPQTSAGVGGPEGARPAEMRVVDPWGNNFDLSSRGYLGRKTKLPGVRLLAVQVPNPDAACDFYQKQFELDLVERDKDGNIRLSDGTVALLLTKSQVRPTQGVQYFGIQVGDLAGLKKRLQDGGVAVSESALGQIQFSDPEGNQVVVSESGWVQ